jgi:hypothetical protein
MDIAVTPDQPLPKWEPANYVEERLFDLLAVGEFEAALRVLIAAPLVLPGFAQDCDAPDRDRQHMLVREREGVPYLLVFTSPEAMRRAVTADGWRQTSLEELVRSWPEPGTTAQLGLAINPATPILMVIPPEFVPLMTSPSPDPRMDDFEPANDAEASLRNALVVADGDVLLDVLATARVIVLRDALEMDGVQTVVVFTSQQRCDAYLAQLGFDVRTAWMDLVAVFRQWPGAEYRLAVNPGSPIGFAVEGDRVPAMVSYASERDRQSDGNFKETAQPTNSNATGQPTAERSTTWVVAAPVPTSHPTKTGHGSESDDEPDPDEHPPVILPSDGHIADLLRGWD